MNPIHSAKIQRLADACLDVQRLKEELAAAKERRDYATEDLRAWRIDNKGINA
jgi:hypothetical protein